MTLATVRLLTDDRECLALFGVWLMGSVSLSGSLSTRRIAEGQRVCALPSSALRLERDTLIDIPEVLINKRTHTFLISYGVCFVGKVFWLRWGFFWDEHGGTERLSMLCRPVFCSLNRFDCVWVVKWNILRQYCSQGVLFVLIIEVGVKEFTRRTADELTFLSPSVVVLSSAGFELYPHVHHCFS